MADRHWLMLSLSIVALCGVPLVGWGSPLVITVAPEAQVQGPQMMLGELAEIQGEPADTVARMRQVLLGQAPPAGVERQLSRSSIVTQLRHQGFAVQEVQFQGAPQVRVTRAAQRLEPPQMEAAVRQALSRRLSQTPPQPSIRDIRGLSAVFVPPGLVEYEVIVPGRNALLGPTPFTLAIHVAGKVEKQLHGTAYISIAQEVVSLVRPVAQGEIITADAVSRTQVQVTQPLRQAVLQPEEVIGKRAQRSLADNAPLSTRDVAASPVIQKGDLIHIVVESSLIKVSTPGVALEAGKLGDTIRVKNTSSNREIRAQVIDKQTVRIPL
jgi:flagellar basal body P-ring formation protein FlgA